MKRLSHLFLFLLIVSAQPAAAGDFWDLWLAPDQRASWYFGRGEYGQAAQYFTDDYQKADAYYRAGNFSSAIDVLADNDGFEALFLKANSLARLERLEPAIATYQQALALRPQDPDTLFNLKWVTGLFETDQKTYDDAGGTGGKLGADRTVSGQLQEGQGTAATQQQLRTEGLSDAEMETLWMRRVDTSLGDFLRVRFAYQYQNPAIPPEAGLEE